MEQYTVKHTAEGLRVEGHPEIVKLIVIDNAHAKELKNYASYIVDLAKAEVCLTKLEASSDDVIKDALWGSAIMHYLKCFNHKTFPIPIKTLLKDDAEGSRAQNYYEAVYEHRTKHDEDSVKDFIACAALNDGTKENKIEQILTLPIIYKVMTPETIANLKLLVNHFKTYASDHFDRLINTIIPELEAVPYVELEKRTSVDELLAENKAKEEETNKQADKLPPEVPPAS